MGGRAHEAFHCQARAFGIRTVSGCCPGVPSPISRLWADHEIQDIGPAINCRAYILLDFLISLFTQFGLVLMEAVVVCHDGAYYDGESSAGGFGAAPDGFNGDSGADWVCCTCPQ